MIQVDNFYSINKAFAVVFDFIVVVEIVIITVVVDAVAVVTVMLYNDAASQISEYLFSFKTTSKKILAICEDNSSVTSGFVWQRGSHAERFWCPHNDIALPGFGIKESVEAWSLNWSRLASTYMQYTVSMV